MKRYNTPHRHRVIKTRLTEEEYAEFSERVSLCKMSQAEFIRQALTKSRIRPVITVSPVNDELLSAVGKLTAEYGKIGGNLNQIARCLNEYGAPYNALSQFMKEKKPMGPPPGGFIPPMAHIDWVKRKYLDIPYATESKAQALDIYLPEKGEGPFAVLIHIHGGGFMIGDKRDDHMDAYLKALYRNMAAVSIEYRLSSEAVFPAAVLDVRAAIRFLKEHADEYHLDAEKFIVIGGSAGGNLAAMLGMNIPNGQFPGEEQTTYHIEPTVALAIDQFGPMNFLTMDEQAKANGISNVDHDSAESPESKYLGGAIQENKDIAVKANPATYAGPDMCKFLVQHGSADVLVPYEQSIEFTDAVRKKCGDNMVEFTRLEGANHEDKSFFAEDNMNLVFDFIARNLP